MCTFFRIFQAIPPSHWDVEVSIPTQGTFSCGLLETRSREGFVEAQHCSSLQAFTKPKCGCVPKSSLTPPPTQMPSLRPSSSPTIGQPSSSPTSEQPSSSPISEQTSPSPTVETTQETSAQSSVDSPSPDGSMASPKLLSSWLISVLLVSTGTFLS